MSDNHKNCWCQTAFISERKKLKLEIKFCFHEYRESNLVVNKKKISTRKENTYLIVGDHNINMYIV